MDTGAYLVEVRLCGEVGGGGHDDALDGEGTHRKPRAKRERTASCQREDMCVILRVCGCVRACVVGCVRACVFVGVRARARSLLDEGVPVLLSEVPGQQGAGEAPADSADDQRQLRGLDQLPPQTLDQDAEHTPHMVNGLHRYSALQHCLTFSRSCTHSHADGGVSHAGRQSAGQEQSG